MLSIIIIALLLNLLIETSESFTVVVPGDPVEAHVGSTVILPCWISPPENAEALEIRWYRHDFNNPIVFYRDGKIQDIQECFRNRTSLTLRSDQSGGLKDGDVSLRLEKLTFQDEGPFHCYVSGDTVYGSQEVDLKVTERSSVSDPSDPSDPSGPSGPWKALFFSVLVFALLGLVGLIFYKYRHKLTGKKELIAIVGDANIEELRKHAVEISIDCERSHPDLKVSEDCKIVRDSPEYNHTGEGFPYELCAFGAQRFTSGRHYWEVDLVRSHNPPKNYWLIGVVKEGSSASRDRSAVTPSAGFWFLCSDGPNGFHTNTDQSITFSLTPRPERLGVLLDYDDGQLSFYNVTESKHLLTISSRFSGSVVPLFNPGAGDQSELEILDCPIFVESSKLLLVN